MATRRRLRRTYDFRFRFPLSKRSGAEGDEALDSELALAPAYILISQFVEF